ncbi:MAG: hypothetical protein V3V08_12560 [Nannocystaceae bacterium]
MSRLLIGAMLSTLCGCAPGDGLAPGADGLRLPTGLAIGPGARSLFVTNGDWDQKEDSSTLVRIDLQRFEDAVARPMPPGSVVDGVDPCRRLDDDLRVECALSVLIDDEQTVRLGRGAGNIAVDFPKDQDTAYRLLIPTRIEPSVVWVDVVVDGRGSTRVDCGQGPDRFCDAAHTLGNIGPQPAMIRVDGGAFRFAYLPHLLGRKLTLIALDGVFGPERVDEAPEFFRNDPLHDSGLGGGFAVAQRACDVAAGNAPVATLECERPYLYATHRFWWGLRAFRVAPGRDQILAGGNVAVLGTSVAGAQPRPIMGDAEFEDPQTGHRLLVVHTTPPALSRVDTGLDEVGNTKNDLMGSVSVCNNPNMLEIYRAELGPDFAFVSCYGAAEVLAVDLEIFAVVAAIDVGAGPNEMVVDATRRWLYVANTLDHTISVVDLRREAATYMREFAVLGLGRALPE